MDEFKARAEHEMQEAGKEIMEKALAEHKAALDAKWYEFRKSLYSGDSDDDRNVDWVVDRIRDNYELPRLKKI